MTKYRIPSEPVVQPQDQSIRYIPLTKGQVAIVDSEDFIRLSSVSWSAQWSKCTKSFYARTTSSGKLMHRIIMGLTDPKIHCDHWNGNTLDNRRENLRVVTRSENMRNSKTRTSNTSGYPGVFWHTRDQKWTVYINVNNKRMYFGYYDDKNKAIEQRKAAEKKYFGEFAYSTRH